MKKLKWEDIPEDIPKYGRPRDGIAMLAWELGLPYKKYLPKNRKKLLPKKKR